MSSLPKLLGTIPFSFLAGVPGRNEIDDTQEINYPPIMREIVKTGYTGYVAQEFIPLRDPMQSLREAVKLCDV